MLSKLTVEHAKDFHRWISNKKAVQYSLSSFLPDRDYTWSREYIKKISSDPKAWNQVIVFNGLNIGYCGLSGISETNKCAEFFILIGDDEYWNQGIGTKAGTLVLKYGFMNLNLNRIGLTVSECNIGAIRSYQKIGFVQEGVIRKTCFRGGKFHDKVIMGVLNDEWS
ncbi:MAG: GNAT family N-acetyltransferase [Nitrospinales bacterium]